MSYNQNQGHWTPSDRDDYNVLDVIDDIPIRDSGYKPPKLQLRQSGELTTSVVSLSNCEESLTSESPHHYLLYVPLYNVMCSKTVQPQ